jgi:hypothetical protein
MFQSRKKCSSEQFGCFDGIASGEFCITLDASRREHGRQRQSSWD